MPTVLYPFRNSAPLLCSGVTFQIIPAGFNPLRQRLRGECPAGISNRVYFFLLQYGKENNMRPTFVQLENLPPLSFEAPMLEFDLLYSVRSGVNFFKSHLRDRLVIDKSLKFVLIGSGIKQNAGV